MDIAVIGGGVSGLVTAHLLAPSHAVTLFEAADYPGGHTNTVRVDTVDNTYWVDTGFIVFNDRTYPPVPQAAASPRRGLAAVEHELLRHR